MRDDASHIQTPGAAPAAATSGRVHVGVDAVGAVRGGGAVVARAVVDALVAEGAQVTVWCSPREAYDPRDPSLSPGAGGSGARWVPQPAAHRWRGRLGWWAHGVEQIAAQDRVDVVLSMNGAAQVRFRPFAALVQQGLSLDEATRRSMSATWRLRLGVLRALLRAALPRARAVYVQTPWVRDALIAQRHASAERVSVVTPHATWFDDAESGVLVGARRVDAVHDVPRRGDSVVERVFLWVGHDLPYKDLNVAARSVLILRGLGVRATLLATVDEDVLCAACDVRVSGHQRDALIATGALDRAALRALMSRVDGLIMTSRCETMGLPLVEAMSQGCPVVSVNMPYARAVCGDAARYATPRSAHALAYQLRAMLRSGDEYRALGRARHAQLVAQDAYGTIARDICSRAGSR